MPLTDAEVTHLLVTALTAPTARDKQTRAGASDLASQCDACLAHTLAGRKVRTRIADRPFMGSRVGTAIHELVEYRLTAPEFREAIRTSYAGAIEVEGHHFFGDFDGYGQVGGSIDIGLPEEAHLIDLKKSTRAGSMLMQNALAAPKDAMSGSLPVPEGHWERVPWDRKKIMEDLPRKISLSERDYMHELAVKLYTLDSYNYQQQLYMHGSPYRWASLGFINQDEASTGYFDNPLLDGYDPEEGKKHDIWVVSFPYDESVALALLERGQRILRELAAGADPTEFTVHPLCFVHSVEDRDAVKLEVAADQVTRALAVAA